MITIGLAAWPFTAARPVTFETAGECTHKRWNATPKYSRRLRRNPAVAVGLLMFTNRPS